jgi:hypothetical protein
MRSQVVGLALAAMMVLGLGGVGSSSSWSPSARSFRNCTALNRVYPHGVGTRHARDHTSGTPVTNFKRSNRLYWANDGLDRDKDRIACEKR